MSRRTVAGVLVRARQLIETPSRWCQEESALSASDDIVSATSVVAAKWCADGALTRAAGGNKDLYRKAGKLLDDASAAIEPAGFVIFNDRMSHADVLAMFDRAIRFAQSSVYVS